MGTQDADGNLDVTIQTVCAGKHKSVLGLLPVMPLTFIALFQQSSYLSLDTDPLGTHWACCISAHLERMPRARFPSLYVELSPCFCLGMEQESSCYMFLALDKRGEERLLIFATNPGGKTDIGGRTLAYLRPLNAQAGPNKMRCFL